MQKEKRDNCRAAILSALEQAGELSQDQLMTIYEQTYPSATRARTRLDRFSNFLGRMESDGLIRCSYTCLGYVTSARRR